MSAPAESGRGASPGGPEPALPEAAATIDSLLELPEIVARLG